MQHELKVQALDQLAAHLEAERAAGRRIVMCHGVFDLLHPGHIQHFQQARALGDLLVVTVTADAHVNKGPGRPVFTQRLRMNSLAALGCIDYVALSEWPTAVEAIRRLRPHFYVKGKEYSDPEQDVTGGIKDEAAAVAEVGGQIHFSDGEVFSSSSLINRHFRLLSDQAEEYLQQFRGRYSIEEVVDRVRRVATLNVLVVGDIIIDQYFYCTPLAKSPRDMILAAKYQSEEQFAGGSIAIANHLAGLCRGVTLLATMGPEKHLTDFVRANVRSNVKLELVPTAHRPTVVKQRFLEPVRLAKMFEVQYLDDTPHDAATDDELGRVLERAVAAHDLVVVADFGHGLITERLRRQLCDSGKFLAVNTQTNSANLGFNKITKYERLDYGCLTELEMRISTGAQYGPIVPIVQQLMHRQQGRHYMITAGPEGTTFLDRDGGIHETPALAPRVIDRVGAGDTVFSATTPLVYTGCESDIIGFVGNCAGAIAVQTVCNRSFIDTASLCKYMMHLLK
jgi:rfaE bifunctional protein nucleotidyltransferase chain/domain